jgi:hypothetical protein
MAELMKLVQSGRTGGKTMAAAQMRANRIVETLEANLEGEYEGLPRLVNPKGVDDTDKVIRMIEERWPALPDYPNQRHNRRALYMSIYTLRQNAKHGGIGWQCDKEVKKGDYAPEIGKSRLH